MPLSFTFWWSYEVNVTVYWKRRCIMRWEGNEKASRHVATPAQGLFRRTSQHSLATNLNIFSRQYSFFDENNTESEIDCRCMTGTRQQRLVL